MQVDIPIIMCQFDDDVFCNAEKYPSFYEAMREGMNQEAAAGMPGHRNPLFFFTENAGDHDSAEVLCLDFDYSKAQPMVQDIWKAMWNPRV